METTRHRTCLAVSICVNDTSGGAVKHDHHTIRCSVRGSMYFSFKAITTFPWRSGATALLHQARECFHWK
ncbi:unnamed protein product, partial [Nesidiocoris tenuis]